MIFFPKEHTNITILPLMPADAISRIQALTKKGIFSGTFLGNMFSISYSPKITKYIKIPLDPVITGYFSTNKKDIILDYNMSKMGKIKMLCMLFILPVLFVLLYKHIARIDFSHPLSLAILGIFYVLCSSLIYLLSIVAFKIKQKKIHNKLFIQILY